jgi:hypothetical protein
MPFADWKGSAFERYLLPIIPAGAKLSRNSKLTPEKIGKVPGKWTSEGWVGFHGWQEYTATAADLERWAKWYKDVPETIGMCLGDYIFIDLDITDEALAARMKMLALFSLGAAPIRCRSNSSKCGLLYRLDHARSSRFIRKSRLAFEKDGVQHAIEVLGKGEQFVVEGLHPSGVVHQWTTHPLHFELTPITPEKIAWHS